MKIYLLLEINLLNKSQTLRNWSPLLDHERAAGDHPHWLKNNNTIELDDTF
jgi:hypothetical protein